MNSCIKFAVLRAEPVESIGKRRGIEITGETAYEERHK